ncbi:MAG: GTPase, partial [Hungatella sp.]
MKIFQKTKEKPKKKKTVDHANISHEEVEKRIDQILAAYQNAAVMIDGIPDQYLPFAAKTIMKKALLENPKIQEFIYGLEHRRPPRFMIVGRTGVGKSSLINAMLGIYAAETSAVEIGTKGVIRHAYEVEGKTSIEVLDTRGVGESFDDSRESAQTAETALLHAMLVFSPDAILFVEPCANRDRLNQDAKITSRMLKRYRREYHLEIPVFVVLNRADEVEPIQEKDPSQFSNRKLANMKTSVGQVRKVLEEQDISYIDILPVCSYIDWGHTQEELSAMSQEERENLPMLYDGRYQIEELMELILDNMQVEASMGLAMVGKAETVLNKLAVAMVGIFSLAAGGVPVTNFSVGTPDNIALTGLQAIMVLFISMIGGIRLSFKQACDYIVGFGGTFATGQLFKMTSHVMSGTVVFFIQRFFPMIPQKVSALFINCGLAGGGTAIIGLASVRHFIQGISLTKVKSEFGGQVKEKMRQL